MDKIKKSEIKEILAAYSVRKDEFIPVTDNGNMYKSRFARGYHITITAEADGRISVSHSDRKGYRTHIDLWQRTENGLEWFCRNTIDVPLSDREVIRELEKQISELKVAGRKLQAQVTEQAKPEPKQEYQKLSKSAGRPKETARIGKVVEEIRGMIDSGCKDKAIMEQLQITRPTYYRYKRML